MKGGLTHNLPTKVNLSPWHPQPPGVTEGVGEGEGAKAGSSAKTGSTVGWGAAGGGEGEEVGGAAVGGGSGICCWVAMTGRLARVNSTDRAIIAATSTMSTMIIMTVNADIPPLVKH